MSSTAPTAVMDWLVIHLVDLKPALGHIFKPTELLKSLQDPAEMMQMFFLCGTGNNIIWVQSCQYLVDELLKSLPGISARRACTGIQITRCFRNILSHSWNLKVQLS